MESTPDEVLTMEMLHNLSISELISLALADHEGELAANQALIVKTGIRTGRSPKDRFIVKDEITENKVDWNAINQPISAEKFTALWEKANQYLRTKDKCYVSQLRVGEHEKFGIDITVITELAWQNLFANVLFIHKENTESPASSSAAPSQNKWTVISVPGFKTDPVRDGVASDAAILLDFTRQAVLVCGTGYAGEIKKAMFSVLNFLLPDADILPMHCAANAAADGSTALFFGLSGTGKTTLSADPERFLIGDDEHGWGADGIFNFEGGCYAKCIDLSKEREPLIWNAIRYGTVVENIILNRETREPDYSDASITQNTRAAYPREYIAQRVEKNSGEQPDAVLFLTCDLYGVLPPVAKLNIEQAAYYFLSGYTALVGSTEVGQGSGIQPTFSACFGAPFFPRPPRVYAKLLMKRLKEHPAHVFLINTGWTGGAHGHGGERFPIPTTRAIVSAILSGHLQKADYDVLPGFNLQIPRAIEGIEPSLLDPRKNWRDQTEYEQTAKLLIEQFIANFKRFHVDDEIRNAGPK